MDLKITLQKYYLRIVKHLFRLGQGHGHNLTSNLKYRGRLYDSHLFSARIRQRLGLETINNITKVELGVIEKNQD